MPYKILNKKTGKFIATKFKISSIFEATRIARMNADYKIIEIEKDELERIDKRIDAVRTEDLFK